MSPKGDWRTGAPRPSTTQKLRTEVMLTAPQGFDRVEAGASKGYAQPD